MGIFSSCQQNDSICTMMDIKKHINNQDINSLFTIISNLVEGSDINKCKSKEEIVHYILCFDSPHTDTRTQRISTTEFKIACMDRLINEYKLNICTFKCKISHQLSKGLDYYQHLLLLIIAENIFDTDLIDYFIDKGCNVNEIYDEKVLYVNEDIYNNSIIDYTHYLVPTTLLTNIERYKRNDVFGNDESYNRKFDGIVTHLKLRGALTINQLLKRYKN